jgi:hypothetical protein
MRVQEFLVVLGGRLTEAEDRMDVQECQRLARLGIDTFKDYLVKCETAQASPSPQSPADPQERC